MLPSDGGSGGLFLSPVPEPQGDPAALSRGAATYTAAHGEIERNRAALASAASQAGGTAWSGTGAAGYVSATTDLAATYALTSAALASGATALRAYSADLTTAKETTRQANAAVAASNAAATALLAAEDTARQSATAAAEASQAATTAETQAAANPHSPAATVAAQNARSAATGAQTSANSASGRVSVLTAQYDADHSRALTLITEAQTQATQAASKAASGFDAAATGLMGKSPAPAHGGATGVPGGSPWQDLIGELADWNDKAGWGLNAWGAFGAVVLGKAEVGYLEAAAGLGKAIDGFDGAVNAIQSGGGFFSTGYYGKVDALNEAFGARRDAAGNLLDAIRPATSDRGFVTGILGRAGLGLGMASDVVTMVAPTKSFGPDGLLGGNTDRVMAGLNFGASGLALGSSFGLEAAGAALAIPGVNIVVGGVLIGTAVYFGGEFVYQHWHDIAGLGDSAWHGIEDAGSWAGHEATSLGHDIGKAFSWL